MTTRILLALLLAFVLVPTVAQAVDLLDLNVPDTRIPPWYPFDETTYDAARSWPEYDVTCETEPCGSGKTAHEDAPGDPNPFASCTSVTTSTFSTTMQCFIDAAPDDSVLYLPVGVYIVTSSMELSRSNIVVRGAGPLHTILNRTTPGRNGDCDHPFGRNATGGHHASVCGPDWKRDATSWTGGYALRDETVNVGEPELFEVDGWIRLRMRGNTACAHIDKLAAGSVEPDAFIHIAQVTDVSGNAITMDRGLRMDYAAAGCTGHEAIPYYPVENVGLESMRFTSDPSIPVCDNSNTCIRFNFVLFEGAVNSWVTDSQFDRAYEMWTAVKQSSRIWYQGNDFTNIDETIWFSTEGMYLVEGAGDVVWENNICTGTRVCQKIDSGAEGNITAYNYMRQDQELCERSYMNHGHYGRENLFEGNDVNCEVMITDRVWGKNGPRITAYRNRNVSTVCNGNRDMISVNADGGVPLGLAASDLNIIGNTSAQFGASPTETCPIASNNDAMSDLVDELWTEKNAYRLFGSTFDVGDQNDYSCGVSTNDSCPGTNKQTDSPDVSWSGSYPTSLYRTTVPSWWCEEACPWDQTGIGAFGDDFSGTLCKLPAQIRAESGACTPVPEPSSAMLLIAGLATLVGLNRRRHNS